ncbi:transposase [Candidatus Albibeggiatoa sp. nov. BB20]|uniref:transposase n=1 Tax=Candidatus Albibeggiatoa sp. nov. BB20 TaxID=3162723 RepID=UPI0033653146
MDETGIEQGICREHGWVERGQQLALLISGKRKRRINIIAGLLNGKLIEPMMFEGSCNQHVIEAYFKNALLPAVGKGFTIILDNASFHKSKTLAQMVEQTRMSVTLFAFLLSRFQSH